MTKKNFKKGFSGLLGEGATVMQKDPPTTSILSDKKVETTPTEKRATFIVSNEQLDAIKAISFWERRMLKDVLKDALSSYIENYEKENGEIKYPQ